MSKENQQVKGDTFGSYQSLDVEGAEGDVHPPAGDRDMSFTDNVSQWHLAIHPYDKAANGLMPTGRGLTLMLVIAGIIATALLFTNHPTELPLMGSYKPPKKIMHISDTHVDFFFDPTRSMQSGVCHTCRMSNKVYGNDRLCPDSIEPEASDRTSQKTLVREGYSFGRYGCNPPEQLLYSLHQQMITIDNNPEVVIFTGDISPHGYPDDGFKSEKGIQLDSLCDTKFLVTEKMVKNLVTAFPNTRWAFTMGNNDHFPKDTFWLPYVQKLGDMFLSTGFFTQQQHDDFVQHGSNLIDIDGVRYMSIDFTIFMAKAILPPTGDTDKSTVAAYELQLRDSVVAWVRKGLAEARIKGLAVWIVGHQPLNTNKGKDEFSVEGVHYLGIKDTFTEYGDIIKVGLFGHRNVAGLAEVLSNDFHPIFPSLTAPGVSPRGKNNPSFMTIYQDADTKEVVDFQQWVFDLLVHNEEAKRMDTSTYLGTWRTHADNMMSWSTLSGASVFSAKTLDEFLRRVPHEQVLFFAVQTWKRGGYIGDETPETYECKSLYDQENAVASCLFANQNPLCWSNKWLS